MDAIRNLVAVLTGALLLSGCYTYVPHRTQLVSEPCHANEKWEVSSECARAIRETNGHYRLYFVEFDDQGWLFPEDHKDQSERLYHDAGKQLKYLMDDLNRLAEDSDAGYSGLNIVVYVHGWKHNAAAGDGDVKNFRRLLAGIAEVEQHRANDAVPKRLPRRIVGVYVGWRGRSLDLPEPLINVSFWDRKSAAQDVAIGSSRELFARLNHFRDKTNKAHAGAKDPAVRFLVIGHSFGGLLVYNAIANSLVTGLVEMEDNEAADPFQGNMIVLLNPAFEATRHEALHRLAAGLNRNRKYRVPVLVMITSTADWATRLAFPFGRYFNTFFESDMTPKETEADSNTPGHVDGYITHNLTSLGRFMEEAQKSPEMVKLAAPVPGCAEELPAAERKKVVASDGDPKRFQSEIKAAQAFFEANRDFSANAGWVRVFCGPGGGTVLWPVEAHNSPIWNIRTDETLVPGHSDILDGRLVAFVRQLYQDLVIAPMYRQ